MFCFGNLCYVMVCAMLCYVMSGYVMLCHVMLCSVLLCFVCIHVCMYVCMYIYIYMWLLAKDPHGSTSVEHVVSLSWEILEPPGQPGGLCAFADSC